MRCWASMSGRLFVAVWAESGVEGELEVVRVVEWYNWLTIPPVERPLHTTMVRARDELEAYLHASSGVEWYNQEGAN